MTPATKPRPRRRLLLSETVSHRLVDACLAVLSAVLVAIGTALIDDNYNTSGIKPIGLGILLGAPVLVSRKHPLAAWAALVAAMVTYPFFVSVPISTTPLSWPPTVLIAYTIVMYAVSVRLMRWSSVGVWILGVALGALAWELNHVGFGSANVSLLAIVSGLGLLAGDNVRGRREARAQLQAEEQRSEELRREARAQLQAEEQRSEELRTRRVLLEERARIARELHDVVAHHMSVIAVQASTAAYRTPALSPEAQAEFESIGDTARASLTELRRLLAVLRSEDDSGQRSPQPGLGDIDELVRNTQSAGLSITLSRIDVPERLPEALALTVYRILQEALSNIVRHAPGATVRAELRGQGGMLLLDVVNDAPPRPGDIAVVPPGAGHGILGMRERAELLGGHLLVGASGGGFRVTAFLPLDATEQS